ncbi:MAG: hypothetical protein M1834_001203 [Cirrosporium novae-zelandiae]|nr:MAG: hypothetical protein M1834_001203 [Cirrosporium novae-zelandiae]
MPPRKSSPRKKPLEVEVQPGVKQCNKKTRFMEQMPAEEWGDSDVDGEFYIIERDYSAGTVGIITFITMLGFAGFSIWIATLITCSLPSFAPYCSASPLGRSSDMDFPQEMAEAHVQFGELIRQTINFPQVSADLIAAEQQLRQTHLHIMASDLPNKNKLQLYAQSLLKQLDKTRKALIGFNIFAQGFAGSMASRLEYIGQRIDAVEDITYIDLFNYWVLENSTATTRHERAVEALYEHMGLFQTEAQQFITGADGCYRALKSLSKDGFRMDAQIVVAKTHLDETLDALSKSWAKYWTWDTSTKDLNKKLALYDHLTAVNVNSPLKTTNKIVDESKQLMSQLRQMKKERGEPGTRRLNKILLKGQVKSLTFALKDFRVIERDLHDARNRAHEKMQGRWRGEVVDQEPAAVDKPAAATKSKSRYKPTPVLTPKPRPISLEKKDIVKSRLYLI